LTKPWELLKKFAELGCECSKKAYSAYKYGKPFDIYCEHNIKRDIGKHTSKAAVLGLAWRSYVLNCRQHCRVHTSDLSCPIGDGEELPTWRNSSDIAALVWGINWSSNLECEPPKFECHCSVLCLAGRVQAILAIVAQAKRLGAWADVIHLLSTGYCKVHYCHVIVKPRLHCFILESIRDPSQWYFLKNESIIRSGTTPLTVGRRYVSYTLNVAQSIRYPEVPGDATLIRTLATPLWYLSQDISSPHYSIGGDILPAWELIFRLTISIEMIFHWLSFVCVAASLFSFSNLWNFAKRITDS
jgi:hypothetical protein